MLDMAGIILRSTLCPRQHTSAKDKARRSLTSDPAHCHWLGADLMIHPPVLNAQLCRPAPGLCRWFSANLQVLNWSCLSHEMGGRQLDTRPARTVWPAGGAVPSQLVCTISYSPSSPLVSPPLCSIAMEKPCWCMYLTSVQMHLFEKDNEILTYLEQTGTLCFLLSMLTDISCLHTPPHFTWPQMWLKTIAPPSV